MKRYWFELVDASYISLGAFIPDGWHKSTAIAVAKRWMLEHGVARATLVCNSMRTCNILDMIPIEVELKK